MLLVSFHKLRLVRIVGVTQGSRSEGVTIHDRAGESWVQQAKGKKKEFSHDKEERARDKVKLTVQRGNTIADLPGMKAGASSPRNATRNRRRVG